MKIAFAVDLEQDPDDGHAPLGTRIDPIPFSSIPGTGDSDLPSAQRSFPSAGTTAALTVELWWIQGCCPVVTIESTGTTVPPSLEKITRGELAKTIESLLQGSGAGGMRLPDIFPRLPLAAPHRDGAQQAGGDGSWDWPRLFVDSPAPGGPAVAFSRIESSSQAYPELLRLGLEANVNRMAHGLRSWAEGPAGGDEAEFTFWQVSGTALLHRITSTYVSVGTQIPAPGTAFDLVGPLVGQLRRLHADATTVIPPCFNKPWRNSGKGRSKRNARRRNGSGAPKPRRAGPGMRRWHGRKSGSTSSATASTGRSHTPTEPSDWSSPSSPWSPRLGHFTPIPSKHLTEARLRGSRHRSPCC